MRHSLILSVAVVLIAHKLFAGYWIFRPSLVSTVTESDRVESLYYFVPNEKCDLVKLNHASPLVVTLSDKFSKSEFNPIQKPIHSSIRKMTNTVFIDEREVISVIRSLVTSEPWNALAKRGRVESGNVGEGICAVISNGNKRYYYLVYSFPEYRNDMYLYCEVVYANTERGLELIRFISGNYEVSGFEGLYWYFSFALGLIVYSTSLLFYRIAKKSNAGSMSGVRDE